MALCHNAFMSADGDEHETKGGEGLSFNPATWAAAKTVPPSLPPGPAPAPPHASRRRLIIGGGAAGGVLLVGGGLLAVWRSASPKIIAQGNSGAPAPPLKMPAASVDDDHQVLTLPDLPSLRSALVSYGLGPPQANQIAAAAITAMPAPPGDNLRLELSLKEAHGQDGATFNWLTLSRPDGSGVKVTAAAQGPVAIKLAASVQQQVKVVRGQVDKDSFYSSAVTAGLSDAMIPEFFQAFVYDFDFQREIEPGAAFEAVLEQSVNDQGTVVGKGRIVFAGMTTAKKALALYRFDAPGAKPDDSPWYDGSGRSVRRGLMRTPVQGARISSSFGLRVHPILAFEKLHKGTDFAAPVGTPIYAAGDGVVEWAASKGPNGNLTILKHDNGWETYYLHQNAFAPGVVPDARVRQAQMIGWVGTTGQSSGPHLHYELHINGEAVDAMAQPLGAGKTLRGDVLKAFNRERDRIDAFRSSSL